MNVTITQPVQISLHSMNDEDHRRVTAWFDFLKKNWGTDEFLRKNSRKLPTEGNVYLLDTLSDLLIFFSVEGEEISILEVGRPKTLEMFREAMARQNS
jgi:hypothetical protein